MGIVIGILFIFITMVVPCYYVFKAAVAEHKENIEYGKLERERANRVKQIEQERANKTNCRH